MNRVKNFEEEYVDINGVEHYLLHYKIRKEAPVLIFLHGGPGQSEAMIAYIVEEYASRNYNIVYYDQRGAGKTYLKNKKARPDTETLKEDLLEIVLYVKKVYQKDKVGILGHSWGSVLGSMFALEHPEHILCYIGCGQVINLMENERVGYLKLKEAIERSGNEKDRKKLEKIGEYPVEGTFDIKTYQKMGKVRKLQGKYHLAAKFDKSMIRMFRESPIMGMADLFPFLAGVTVNMQVMKELMSFDLKRKGWDFGDDAWLHAPAGLVRTDNTEKPAYHALRDLIHGAWETHEHLTTDSEGYITFTGFKGNYAISSDGRSVPLELTADKQETLTL